MVMSMNMVMVMSMNKEKFLKQFLIMCI
jgi:hypothetical protein